MSFPGGESVRSVLFVPKELKRPIVEGIVELSEFVYSESLVKLVMAPISDGMAPVRWLLERFRLTRFVRREISGGMALTNSLLRRPSPVPKMDYKPS